VADPTPPAGGEPGSGPADAEIQPTWRRSLRDVGWVAVAVVGIVLGAAVVTDFLPEAVRGLIVDTPLAIAVLIGGTAWLLWRIGRRRSDDAE